MTIGDSSIDVGPAWPSGAPFHDQVIISAGTSMRFRDGSTRWEGGPAGPNAVTWATPPFGRDPGDGTTQPVPQNVAGNWPGNRVLIAQLAVTPDGNPFNVQLTGSMALTIQTDGKFEVIAAVLVGCE